MASTRTRVGVDGAAGADLRFATSRPRRCPALAATWRLAEMPPATTTSGASAGPTHSPRTTTLRRPAWRSGSRRSSTKRRDCTAGSRCRRAFRPEASSPRAIGPEGPPASSLVGTEVPPTRAAAGVRSGSSSHDSWWAWGPASPCGQKPASSAPGVPGSASTHLSVDKRSPQELAPSCAIARAWVAPASSGLTPQPVSMGVARPRLPGLFRACQSLHADEAMDVCRTHCLGRGRLRHNADP